MVTNEKPTSIPDGFEKAMIKTLEESKLIEHVMIGDILDDVNTSTIINLLKSPKDIELRSEGLVFIDKNGDVIACPQYGENIPADGKWLSNKISPVIFDIDQNGNLRKSDEAQAAYCCCIVVIVLDDKDFKNDLMEVVNHYNFIIQ